MKVDGELSVVSPPTALPLKIQDLSNNQWILLGMAMMLFIFSICAFVVTLYCTSEECTVIFEAAGGAMLCVSVCLGGHVLKYATLKGEH